MLCVAHDINSFSRLIQSDGMQIVVSLVLHLKFVIIVHSRFVEIASDGVHDEDKKSEPHEDDCHQKQQLCAF